MHQSVFLGLAQDGLGFFAVIYDRDRSLCRSRRRDPSDTHIFFEVTAAFAHRFTTVRQEHGDGEDLIFVQIVTVPHTRPGVN